MPWWGWAVIAVLVSVLALELVMLADSIMSLGKVISG